MKRLFEEIEICNYDTRIATFQGWKDSGDAIANGKGEQVFGLIALCELQAYVYIAEQMDQPELAERWRSQARDLQARFNSDFWIESADYCALALGWSRESGRQHYLQSRLLSLPSLKKFKTR